jgi:cytochrome c-type biogenesis protein CcmE
VALSVALVLAIFLVYTALAGGSTPQFRPSQLAGHAGKVSVIGAVVGPVLGDAHSRRGLRFAVRDIGGSRAEAVPVVFHGSVPDLFARGRHVVVEGTYANGRIAASGLQTKCPSKYTASKNT